jgi:hypothetical protein
LRSRLRVLCVLTVLALSLAFVPAATAGPLADVSVTGVVLNASTGVGVPFAHVVVNPDGGGAVVADVMADYRGTFSMTLPPGVYLFSYWIPGGESHLEQVTIPSAPTADASHTIEGYDAQRVYRFFNMKSGTHFYTASDAEFMNVFGTLAGVFTYDGVAYYVEVDPETTAKPLYRFFNRKTGAHLYTADEGEKANVMEALASRYTYEGIAYGVRTDTLGMPVYRFYVPARDTHFYTANTSEITAGKLSDYYHYEGVAYYVANMFK